MRDDNWNYNNGEFYIAFGGNAIMYLEVNPCGCCPNSVLKIVKFGSRRRNSSSTIYFNNIDKELNEWIKKCELIPLKPRRVLTGEELKFWEEYNQKISIKNFKKLDRQSKKILKN